MAERDLIRSIMRDLPLHGVWPLRMNAGRTILRGESGKVRAIRGVEPGTPDVLVLLPDGGAVWLECKTPSGKVSATQRAWHSRAREMGHAVHVVRSFDAALAAVRAS